MVYLREIIKNEKAKLIVSNTIDVACFLYITDKEQLNERNFSFSGEEELALEGFYGKKISSEQALSILNKPKIKGLDFSTNIFKMIGLSLSSFEDFENSIQQKFNQTTLKNKYIIQKAIPSFNASFITALKNEYEQNLITQILNWIYLDDDREPDLNKFTENELDLFDIMILQDVQEKSIKQGILMTKFINLSSKDLIIQILDNFSNAIKKITIQSHRYGTDKQKRNILKIEDEYDVQDILYTMLKGVFPALNPEEPMGKVGAKSSRIDFETEGILIEVKMIKEKDKDEKNFIEQLKVDIQSYFVFPELKDLIFFIYAPDKTKIKDINNFKTLENKQKIGDVEFDIKIIIAN
jgi:hypothetical protein